MSRETAKRYGPEEPWGSYGAVDIGSHTIRVLVADWDSQGFVRPVHHERHVIRLAQGFARQGVLTDEAMDRALRVMTDISDRLQAFPLRHLRCGATGVVRKAANGADFVKRIHERTRWQVSILTEVQEARLSLHGMLSVLPPLDGPTVCFDLGGSSTEFSLVEGGNPMPLWEGSVFIGAATLTEMCLCHAPASPHELRRAADQAREALRPVVKAVRQQVRQRSRSPEGLSVVGTAGTATTLAAMEARMTQYVPYRINNRTLTKTWIADIVRTLASMSLEERRCLAGLEPGREDIIVGGAVIVEEILAAFDVPHLTVTDAGLLEGLVCDGIHAVAASSSDPLKLRWQIP